MAENEFKTVVCGDVHGHWGPLNKMISRHHPDIILQVGDWGWWPKWHNTFMLFNGYEDTILELNDGSIKNYRTYKKWDQFSVKTQGTKLYWCPGNHEDWHNLVEEQNHMGAPVETQENCYYMKRSSILTLPDGRVVLFMGGADSIDKKQRKVGFDWFTEELITQRDIYELPDISVDIVISHTCPEEFSEALFYAARKSGIQGKIYDPSCTALSVILKKYKPDLWFFGHFHFFKAGRFENTEWYCLNMIPESMWWMDLPRRK